MGGRQASAISAVALVLAGLSWSQPLNAQDGRSFWPQPRFSNQPDVRSREPGTEDTERAAIALYAEARDALDTGDMELGQRRLERLVGRYPDTVTASIARRDLKLLYSRDTRPQEAARQEPTQFPRPKAALPSPVQPVPTAESMSPPVAPPTATIATAPPAPRAPQFGTAQGTPMGQPLPPPIAARPSPQDDRAALERASADLRASAGDRLFFGDASVDLGGRAKTTLESVANWLRRNPSVDLVIEGHGDDRGTVEFNGKMAEQRADAVRQRLIDLGVAPQRLASVGLGRTQPVADCAEPQCTAQNRRVVFIVTRANGPLVPSQPLARPNAPVEPGPYSGVTVVKR
jgi:outer membrane protein OmpA-like peptidoglycan-associated protein